jgi:hypothetical protein
VLRTFIKRGKRGPEQNDSGCQSQAIWKEQYVWAINGDGYDWGELIGGQGIWEQYADWADDNAKTDYDRALADIGYDIRTGRIDGHEACALDAEVRRNYCRSGHRNAALIVGGACILTGTVVGNALGAVAAVAFCEGAVLVKLNNEIDVCDLEFSVRKARCN